MYAISTGLVYSTHRHNSTMHRTSVTLCFFVLLLIAFSSEFLQNSKNDNKQYNNSTVRYDLGMNPNRDRSYKNKLMQYNLDKNFTADDDQVWYEFCMNSTKNHEEEEIDRTSMEFSANSTKSKGKDNSTSNEFHENFNKNDDENNIVMHETRNSSVRINLCCPLGYRLLMNEKCVPGTVNYSFPEINGSKLNEVFRLVYQDSMCANGYKHIPLNTCNFPNVKYKFLVDGCLRLTDLPSMKNRYIQPTSYCLAAVYRDKYDVILCWKITITKLQIFKSIGSIVSLPFLLATFMVYYILPELQNMHGYTLRAHVASLFLMYSIKTVFNEIELVEMGYSACIILSFIYIFSVTASFLWLNVICFDIWWRFGELHLLQERMRQEEEKKKFARYSVFVWGSALIILLTIICTIINFIPSVSKDWIRSESCICKRWYRSAKALTLYFYVPMGISVVFNICLFISTTMRIVRHKRNIANQLGNSESRRHDDDEQRFCMYLKLFIVMGMNWIMDIGIWIFEDSYIPDSIRCINITINTLQGFTIFILFVWKREIKQHLLQRLGWQGFNLFCKKSTSRPCQSMAIFSVSSESVVMQQVNSCVQTNHSASISSNDAD